MIKLTKHVIGMLIGMTILTHWNLQATQKSIVGMTVDNFYRRTHLKIHVPKELIYVKQPTEHGRIFGTPCLQSISKKEEYLYFANCRDESFYRQNKVPMCIDCLDIKNKKIHRLFNTNANVEFTKLFISTNKDRLRLGAIAEQFKDNKIERMVFCKWGISNPKNPKSVFTGVIKAKPKQIVPTGCNDFILVYKNTYVALTTPSCIS